MANSQDDLPRFEREILAHWKEQRPKMCRAMEKSGSLIEAVRAAARQRAETEALGSDPRIGEAGARELAREDWCFPSEKDKPRL